MFFIITPAFATGKKWKTAMLVCFAVGGKEKNIKQSWKIFEVYAEFS